MAGAFHSDTYYGVEGNRPKCSKHSFLIVEFGHRHHFELYTLTVHPGFLLGSLVTKEEEQVDTAAVAPGTAPKMSAAKAAKVAAEKEARVAVS